MQGEIFNEHWTALPMSVRALMLFVVPVYAIYLFFFGTKEIIAENIAIDDLASRDEILNYDEEFAKLDSLLVDKRDQVIITRLENLYQANRAEKKTVGVVYGASHMRNIVGFLSEKLGYKITASEWITVFDL
jgi:pheromone shutdown protein TraB